MDPTALSAEKRVRDVFSMASEIVPRPWDMGDLHPPEEADGGVSQRRPASLAMPRPNWRPFLVVHPVAFLVPRNVDAPVSADPRPDLCSGGLRR
jgi:hypothetical protein